MQVSSDPLSGNPQSSGFLKLFSAWFLGLALLVVGGTAAVYLLLALPANDDWVRCVQPHRQGWWHYCKFVYLNWQGRWASFGLESAILPLKDITKIYPALIGTVVVVNLLGLFVICRFFTKSASRWFSFACAAGLAGLLWAQMPSVAQSVNWFTGAVENAMPLALAGMLVVGLLSLGDNIFWIIFAAFFAMVIVGLHEMYGAMLCIALGLGTLCAYWIGSANKRAWLMVLVAAIIGLGIVAGAPGNRVRMQSDGVNHSTHLLGLVKLAGSQFWSSGRAWLFDPKLLAVSLWIAVSPRLEASRPVCPGTRRVPFRLLIPLAWLAILAVGFLAPSYAFGTVMPPRTLSGNFIVFAAGWMLIVFVWTRGLDIRDSVNISGLRSAGSAALARLALAAALLLTGNTLEGLHDLATRKALRWRESVEHRYALLRQAGPEDRVLPRLAPSSRLLYDGEIGTDPADWHNWPLAYRFGLKTVRVLPAAATASQLNLPTADADSNSVKAQ